MKITTQLIDNIGLKFSYILYHGVWVDQSLLPVLQIIFNWLTNSCNTVMW